MEEADRLCDRVAIMDHGHILALDTPAGLKSSIDAETVVRVVTDGDPARLASALRAMPGATDAAVSDGGVSLQVKGITGVVPKVVDAAEAAGFRVNELTSTEPTLETVFIRLTGKDLRE
jgi:ABC-2 type transport system ATP-binding protein